MDPNQFGQYMNGLAQIEQNAETARQNAATQKRRRDTKEGLVKQTVSCDGATTGSVRVWIKEINLAIRQLAPADIVELVTRTITGPLRWEVERFIDQYMVTNNVARNAVPWPPIENHVNHCFLNTDEASALRDEVEATRQSVHEPAASYSRRFRDKADSAYPVAQRNPDQERILIKAYARGLLSDELARKLVQDERPATLEAAITAIGQFSEGQDAYARLGRNEPEPMEVGMASVVKTPASTRPGEITSSVASSQMQQIMDTLLKIGRAQERLGTKVAKLEISQKSGETPTGSGGRRRPQSKDGRLPAWNEEGKPRCFRCQNFGHFARECSGNGSLPQ
jgi:hypothetical protein